MCRKSTPGPSTKAPSDCVIRRWATRKLPPSYRGPPAICYRSVRTLRVEIDLPNKDGELRPGMYAYGRVMIDRKKARALPMAAVTEIGNLNCCYIHENGKAVQTPVQIGINDGRYIEVTRKRVKGEWVDWTGNEDVILADLSELSDGQKVHVEAEGQPN